MEITAVSIRKCAITIQVISTWCFIAKTIANTRKKKTTQWSSVYNPLKKKWRSPWFRNFQHFTVRSILAVIAKQTTQNWSELPFIFQLKSAIQQLHFCCFSVWKSFDSILPPSSFVEESSSCFKLPQVSSQCWKWRRISDISHSLASHTTAPMVSRMSLNASLEIEVFSKTTQYN